MNAIALQRHLANLRFEIEWLKVQILRKQQNLAPNEDFTVNYLHP